MSNPDFAPSGLSSFYRLIRQLLLNSRNTIQGLQNLERYLAGVSTAQQWPSVARNASGKGPVCNLLKAAFDANTEGPGIWKWQHYFDVYHRHLERFVSQEVHILEVGIYSGGSLPMWKNYFGDKCRVYGVDIEPACKAYESSDIQVFIGDQSNRDFWLDFKKQVPVLDIVIDDGGHRSHQQIPTFEELMPHLRPGGVFICEDIHGPYNEFGAYLRGLLRELNAGTKIVEHTGGAAFRAGSFQREVSSMHFYPYMALIEKNLEVVLDFEAPKRGSQWQPFYKD